MLKSTLRSSFSSLRLQLDETDYRNRCIAIANACLSLPIWEATTYHLFMSIPDKREVDTSLLLPILQGKDKNIAVPKVGKNKQLSHYLLEDGSVLKKNQWGIPEPVGGTEIHPGRIDVVFIPLLAFDKGGHRVGYGGGFYDNFLGNCRPDTVRVGLSLFPPVAEISDIHSGDIPLHYCVTPDKTYQF